MAIHLLRSVSLSICYLCVAYLLLALPNDLVDSGSVFSVRRTIARVFPFFSFCRPRKRWKVQTTELVGGKMRES